MLNSSQLFTSLRTSSATRADLRIRVNSGQDHPRLSIGHVILWITVCAFFFVVIQKAIQEEPTILGVLRAAAIVVLESVPVTGAIVIVYRIMRGVPYQIAPGEWLLFVLGAALAVRAVVVVWPKDSIFVPSTIAAALICCIKAAPTLSRRLHWTWKWFFVLFLALDATLLSLDLVANLTNLSISESWNDYLRWIIVTVLTPVTTIVVPWLLAVWEANSERPGCWSHWLGIACFTVWHALNQWLF